VVLAIARVRCRCESGVALATAIRSPSSATAIRLPSRATARAHLPSRSQTSAPLAVLLASGVCVDDLGGPTACCESLG
jgi:hypothetical protein